MAYAEACKEEGAVDGVIDDMERRAARRNLAADLPRQS